MATVRRDFFLDPADRLSEQERALMTAMLEGILAECADELRAGAGPGAAANDDGGLLAELRGSGLLDIPELVALLLRRAEQVQVMGAVQPHGPRREGRLLQVLLSDEDASVSAAAMALILARGRRLDRFGQCRLEFDDVPPPAVRPLVQAVAAAIVREQPAIQPQLIESVEKLVARHDPAKSLVAVTANLIESLHHQRRLDDAWLVAAAGEGECALLAEALARRAAIDPEAAADALLSRTAGELAVLLRLAGASREAAARLLASLCDALGIADPAADLARFDSCTDAELDRARSAMTLPSDYRDALSQLGESRGQRAV